MVFITLRRRLPHPWLVPIPVAGPECRFYLTNSPRVFVEANVYGMYFFGYGNFVSPAGNLGFTVDRHLTLSAGYQLGSRLVVNNSGSADRIGPRRARTTQSQEWYFPFEIGHPT